MKILEFWLKFHWSLFLRVQLTISQHWVRKWLGSDQATSHYLNQWWLDSQCIYASLGLNKLAHYRPWRIICAVFSQYVKVGGDLLKVGGDSSSAKRCGAATPRRGGHGRGFPPPIGGGPGGPPPGNFCKNGSQIQQSGAFWGIILCFIIDFSQALMNKFASIFPQIY